MNPTRTYDYLVLARARILDAVRALPPDAYTRKTPIAMGSLAVTLTHIMLSEWYYIERINGRDVPDYADWPIKYENPLAFNELEAKWAEQAAATRETLARITDWNAPMEYEVTTDEGHRERITANKGDCLTQLFFHEIHHRAQAMSILRHLGTPIEDLDYNSMAYTRRRFTL